MTNLGQTTDNVNLDLEALILDRGVHKNRHKGVCLMEAAAWFAGEPHSDHPQCVDPLLTTIAIRLNDAWADKDRQKLKTLIPFLVGSLKNRDLTTRRSWFLLDRIVRWQLPQTLCDFTAQIASIGRLESLPPITDRPSAFFALDLLSIVEDDLRDYARGLPIVGNELRDHTRDYVRTHAAASANVVANVYSSVYHYVTDGLEASGSCCADQAYSNIAQAFVAASGGAGTYAFAIASCLHSEAFAAGRVFRDQACDHMISILLNTCCIAEMPGAE